MNIEQTNICHSYRGCYGSTAARGKMVAEGGTTFQNLLFQNVLFIYLFFVRALIIKVQSNKKCVSIKRTIKIHFPLLWQLCFYLKIKAIRAIERI